ncbi:ABC transporter ATP-binding protein [Streptococcus oriscaviae]|uniref:ABC transporter ATP-binding protein n=1 Tax=Streptococcus oriscaviae TaxID=2781599 RepID=A0ABX7YLS3_9STRE|nr:ABC transporter ATP-binding protein [Streptococcus oriscaviae]QUE54690.1 ABC transporter ATP-binding protein [Streptococcus oriscaviae]
MTSLFRYFRDYLKESILGPLFKLLEALFELTVPLVIAYIVDSIIPHGNQGDLVAMILLLVGLACVGVLMSITAQYYSAKAAVGYTTELTQDLYKKVLSLPKFNRANLSAASLLTRLSSDTLQIQTGINIFLRLFLRAPIVVFGSFIMAVMISPTLSLLFLGMIAVLFLVVSLISIVNSRLYLRMRKTLDELVGQVRETVSGMRVIRAFGQTLRELGFFKEKNGTYLEQQLKAGFWSSILTPATFLIVNVTLVTLIWQGRLAIESGLLEVGMLVALINYLLQILVELVKMVMVISTLNQSFISAGRVQEIFQQESEDLDVALPAFTCQDKERLLVVQELVFSYPKAAEAALSGIHFQVQRGDFLGIIGGTGSGKSTLLDLLLKFYLVPEQQLQLFIDGSSPRNLREWRQTFALVPQEAQLFSGTVRSNLSLGKEPLAEEELWAALEIAQAKEFVIDKGGLDCQVETSGRNFSGGQRQRLTIARALLQKAPILVLDDATSALDYLTEKNLLEAIREELPEKTLILISQRTKSLRKADCILVLDKGRQVGLGTHEELLHSSAIYQEIDQSQHSQEDLA